MNDFFYRSVSSKPLAFFRAVWGLFLIYYYLKIFWLLDIYYAEDGLRDVSLIFADPPFLQWSFFYWVDHPTIFFYAIYVVGLISALGTLLGCYTRLCSVLTFFCFVSLVTPAQWGTNSADQLTKILSFLFMITGLAGYTARHYSLDCKHRTDSNSSGSIPAWAYRLFQVQLCSIYFFSAISKMGNSVWHNGQAMQIVLTQTDSWMRFDTGLTDYPAFTALLTTAALMFELVLFPLLVWFRRTRLWILGLGVAFHLSIFITMKVFIFTEVMILLYLCFLEEKEVEVCVERIKKVADGVRAFCFRKENQKTA